MMCQLAEREKIFDQQNQPEKNLQFFFFISIAQGEY